MLDHKILESIDKSVLCWLATANEKGEPNVSPKEIFTFFDEHFLIANIASPGSAKNIQLNSKVAVSFIDILEQKGHQLKGIASVIEKDMKEFESLSSPLLKMAGDKFPFISLFKIKIESSKEINAPSYFFFPDIELSDKIEAAKKQYNLT